MLNNNASSPTVRNCVFTANTADGGGAMGNFFGSNPLVEGCTFTANSAAFTAGAVFHTTASPTYRNCAFDNNTAISFGGAMFIDLNSNPTIENCVLSNNSAPGAGSHGGALFMDRTSNPAMENCIFFGNSAERGGVMYLDNSSAPQMVNCTLAANAASDIGGALFVESGSPTAVNCIFWDNTGGEIVGGTPTVTFSDVQGGFAGAGNLDADPLFVNAAGGDLRLSSGSPCIEVGNNAAPNLPPTDLDGADRVVDGNLDATATVDMGAYEFAVSDENNDLDTGMMATLDPQGAGADPTMGSLVQIENVSGPNDATITATVTTENTQPDAGGFGGVANTLIIDTSLADGEFFMTVTIPFSAADLGGTDPFALNLTFYNSGTDAWELAVAANTVASPGHPTPVGDRFTETVPPSLGTLGVRDLGDYGVFWDGTAMTGFVWANVDHTTDFRPAFREFPSDNDVDGDVDGIDFSVFASCFNKAGNPPRTFGCNSDAQDAFDFDNDGDIDGIDFSSFASCFNKAGNPPRTFGCPQN
jgi:hypothetical protein